MPLTTETFSYNPQEKIYFILAALRKLAGLKHSCSHDVAPIA